MRRLLNLFLFFCIALVSEAQVNYVQGYFITSDGQRTDAYILIRKEDWRDNPKSFSYKIGDTGEAREADLNNIKELGLASGEIFHRVRVQMDRSPDDVTRMSGNLQTSELRAPVFATETLFLRLLVSGKAVLYGYDEGNLHRFFFAVDGGEVKQLVYKRYLVRKEGISQLDQTKGDLAVGVNEDYKQQIYNDLKCSDVTMKDIEKLSYNMDKLEKVFTTFNRCSGGESFTSAPTKSKERPIHVTGRLGLAMNSISFTNVSVTGGGSAEISGMLSVRPSLEFEFVLPFGQGDWAIPAEVAYIPLSGESTSGAQKVSGHTLDILVGLRKFFPAGNGKIYLTASMVFANPMVTLTSVNTQIGFKSTGTLQLAGGYKAKRFSGEFAYGFPRAAIQGDYKGNMSGFALIFGYQLNR